MAVTITVEELRQCIGADESEQLRVRRLLATATARVERHAPGAPDAVQNEAAVLLAGWLRQATAPSRSVFPADGEGRVINVSQAFRHSGRSRSAVAVASATGRAQREVLIMRWPWQREPEIRSANYTDGILNSLLANATGGGAKTALATAALGQCAALYGAALASCELSGPSHVTRALGASWRASVASELVRHGQTMYLIDADPARGLALLPVASWDAYGGPDPASWAYRIERAGPSSTSWRTVAAGGVLHLRWLTDPARPWAGVGPLQHAADTGSLAGWLDKRIAEESSGPVGSFLPVARSEVEPGVDFDDTDDPAADPLYALRQDVGKAAGRVLIVESQIAAADSPASAPHAEVPRQARLAATLRPGVRLRQLPDHRLPRASHRGDRRAAGDSPTSATRR